MIYVTIDGPAGSGKSSVAAGLAKKLGFKHLNTGNLYRGVALLWLKAGRPEFSQEFFDMIDKKHFSVLDSAIIMNGEVHEDDLRTLEVGKVVSKVAEVPEIRKIITDKSRDIVKSDNFVVEGRDIGTVVLPDAFLKIFLTASVEERAERRYKELIAKNSKADFEDIINEIKTRDSIDSSREIAPLKPALDAVTVLTDGLSLDDVIEKIYNLYRERIKIAEN
ncbi:MAG: (d)CMP kinase [Thermotogae bacterium]|jgi:cytidylate kinase|nr:(d)CMP kinase [Thermotogota bacterium]MCL5033447.1 (d)CMP kinase [Thermotogota bacterium]